MATIKDVAKLAQVSTATVSRVLNGNGYVHSETKQRVAVAIKELNYRPNDVARNLFKGRSKTIALFVPDIMNPYFPELARAVEDVAQKEEYTFILCNTDDDLEKERKYLEALTQKSLDGLVIVSSTMISEYIKEFNIPVVALDRILYEGVPSVTVNNFEGAQEAVKYLKEIGCKKIAHLAGPQDVRNAEQRRGGYMSEVEQESWFQSSLVERGGYGIEEAMASTTRLLKAHPDIDGLFAANDLMAVGAIKACETLGINIPDQLSIVGFDGIMLGKTTSPSLTTMAQPIYDIGTAAVEMLIQQIRDPDLLIDMKEFQVKLVERGSTIRKEEVT
ncbi:LacI family DNA-binding transcriptional regulator [Salimicrobium flavidum]|uniref:Transcriptional regulator, LacI family n=1 Tax=Salimicrobium flavidum TaxID=570947 RepID=A0A1N7IRS4_9BACI|nr:LacI family DNA-binding transcriptional regulator [Salimicrobium flavidum]SIS39793.1 transcriptional regulator, LacI family [Salimicrobium flavidum]